MAFLIITADGQELLGFALRDTVVIGRSPECAICVRDVSLSRWHCRLERSLGGWIVTDLNSKNGTFMNDRRISKRRLHEGDELKLGRTAMRFHAGPLQQGATAPPPRRKSHRPVDPTEAMASTVEGFVLSKDDAARHDSLGGHENRIYPRPRPPEPAAYIRDDLYTMLTEIASSSWDSIYATVSRPTRWERAAPVPMVLPTRPQAIRRSSGVSMALQVNTPVFSPAQKKTRWERLMNSSGLKINRAATWAVRIGFIRLF